MNSQEALGTKDEEKEGLPLPILFGYILVCSIVKEGLAVVKSVVYYSCCNGLGYGL